MRRIPFNLKGIVRESSGGFEIFARDSVRYHVVPRIVAKEFLITFNPFLVKRQDVSTSLNFQIIETVSRLMQRERRGEGR